MLNIPGFLSYYFIFSVIKYKFLTLLTYIIKFFWENYSFAILAPLLMLHFSSNYFLFKVACTDPGIIPKNVRKLKNISFYINILFEELILFQQRT